MSIVLQLSKNEKLWKVKLKSYDYFLLGWGWGEGSLWTSLVATQNLYDDNFFWSMEKLHYSTTGAKSLTNSSSQIQIRILSKTGWVPKLSLLCRQLNHEQLNYRTVDYEAFTQVSLKKITIAQIPLKKLATHRCHCSQLVCHRCHSVHVPCDFCRLSAFATSNIYKRFKSQIGLVGRLVYPKE
jgi:hypothetical protein